MNNPWAQCHQFNLVLLLLCFCLSHGLENFIIIFVFAYICVCIFNTHTDTNLYIWNLLKFNSLATLYAIYSIFLNLFVHFHFKRTENVNIQFLKKFIIYERSLFYCFRGVPHLLTNKKSFYWSLTHFTDPEGVKVWVYLAQASFPNKIVDTSRSRAMRGQLCYWVILFRDI